jgi:hypothetical protein
MKLRTIVLTGMLLATPIFLIADEATNITALIEKAKNATFFDRFEIIGQIKAQLSTMNEDDRAVAMTEIKIARESVRSSHH